MARGGLPRGDGHSLPLVRLGPFAIHHSLLTKKQGEARLATEVKIPDIGDFKDIPIIEIHVREGDPFNADDPLITLESDKATMEVPAPAAGMVERLLIKLGDRVSQGTPILMMKGGDGAMAQPPSVLG